MLMVKKSRERLRDVWNISAYRPIPFEDVLTILVSIFLLFRTYTSIPMCITAFRLGCIISYKQRLVGNFGSACARAQFFQDLALLLSPALKTL